MPPGYTPIFNIIACFPDLLFAIFCVQVQYFFVLCTLLVVLLDSISVHSSQRWVDEVYLMQEWVSYDSTHLPCGMGPKKPPRLIIILGFTFVVTRVGISWAVVPEGLRGHRTRWFIGV